MTGLQAIEQAVIDKRISVTYDGSTGMVRLGDVYSVLAAAGPASYNYPHGLNVKDLVTLLIASKGPVERFAVLLDPGDGEPMVVLQSARFDHEHQALILEKE